MDTKRALSVEPLRNILKLTDESELPMFYLYHPTADKSMSFPYGLNDPTTVSPELIVVWARVSQLQIELTFLKQRLAENETLPEEQKLPEENLEKIKQMIQEKDDELVTTGDALAQMRDVLHAEETAD